MARDVYSMLHFPMLFGVIAYAALVEEAVADPGEPLPLAGRAMLALAVVLFVGGMAVALWRATGNPVWARAILIIATAMAIMAVAGVSTAVSLGIALSGILAIIVLEQRAQSLVGAERA